jgi:hypothetical protein
VPALFDRLEVSLADIVQQHFFEDPRRFRSLVDVIAVLGSRVELQQSAGGPLSPSTLEKELSVQVHTVHICQQRFLYQKCQLLLASRVATPLSRLCSNSGRRSWSASRRWSSTSTVSHIDIQIDR